jgi:hypothetical protein
MHLKSLPPLFTPLKSTGQARGALYPFFLKEDTDGFNKDIPGDIFLRSGPADLINSVYIHIKARPVAGHRQIRPE